MGTSHEHQLQQGPVGLSSWVSFAPGSGASRNIIPNGSNLWLFLSAPEKLGIPFKGLEGGEWGEGSRCVAHLALQGIVLVGGLPGDPPSLLQTAEGTGAACVLLGSLELQGGRWRRGAGRRGGSRSLLFLPSHSCPARSSRLLSHPAKQRLGTRPRAGLQICNFTGTFARVKRCRRLQRAISGPFLGTEMTSPGPPSQRHPGLPSWTGLRLEGGAFLQKGAPGASRLPLAPALGYCEGTLSQLLLV